MKISKMFIGVSLVSVICLSASASYAGGDHKHGTKSHSHAPVKKITEKQAQAKAQKITKLLVQKGKLKKDWLNAEIKTTTQKKFKKDNEWVIAFGNAKAEKSTQTLYIFLSLQGEYLGANFSGN